METVDLPLEGLKLFKPKVFRDDRGFFLESFRESDFPCDFVQDNHSFSKKDVLRGMHYQVGQAKLVRVAQGRIYDVVVDIRSGSPTFGKAVGVELDGDHHEMLFIPDGLAHGFSVLSDSAHVLYKVSTYYDPEQDLGFRYDDPSVGIHWPVEDPILSERDQNAPQFSELMFV